MTGDERTLRVAWQQHIGSAALPMSWFDVVVAGHREPHRHYHGLRHVCWVVRHVRDLTRRIEVRDVDAIVAAACFHDVIYDPRSSNNEELSAQMANRALDEIGWSGARATQVADMIRATATHLPTLDADTDVLLAADLAVLAAEPAAYSDYVRGVRKEYAHIDEAGWAAGRSAVLRSLLDLDRIYSAALELDTWETRARANITAELAGLLPP